MKTSNYTLKGFITFFVLWCISSFSLQAQQLTPECYVDIEPNRYVIYFRLPPFELHEDNGDDYEEGNDEGADDDCGLFTEIIMGEDVDYDVTDVPGYPALPFFSLNLLLPECVSEVTVSMEPSVIDMVTPDYLITPVINESWEYINEELIYSNEDCYNYEYYNNGYTYDPPEECYPNGFYRDFYSTSYVYTTFGTKGITFSIFPFSYYPHQGYMDILQEAVFVIEFECGDLLSTIEEVQTASSYSNYAAQFYYDTFNEMGVTNNVENNGNYLIVAAHRDMENDLSPYVEYRRAQNYNTEVVYLDNYGAVGNRAKIQNIIRNNDVLLNPDFVLLVGNFSEIPPSAGFDNANDPYRDYGYHQCTGRWITKDYFSQIGGYPDLRNIINKTLQTEIGYTYSYPTAALFSGTDNKKRISRSFYRNIKRVAAKSFSPMGIPYILYDGRNISQNQAQLCMTNALLSSPRFFIYRGHGYGNSYDAGIASPYNISSSNLDNIGNGSSIGFGIACSMNTYKTNDNFGAKWIASETGGGAAFYGATTPSYHYSNNYFAKWIFKTLKKMSAKQENFPLILWLRISELSYYHALRTNYRGIEIDKYTLIGMWKLRKECILLEMSVC